MPKYRPNDLIQDDTLKLPMELELHLTSIFLKGDKVPLPRKMLEWAIHKDHINGFRAAIGISSMKVLINTLEMDVDFGVQKQFQIAQKFPPRHTRAGTQGSAQRR